MKKYLYGGGIALLIAVVAAAIAFSFSMTQRLTISWHHEGLDTALVAMVGVYRSSDRVGGSYDTRTIRIPASGDKQASFTIPSISELVKDKTATIVVCIAPAEVAETSPKLTDCLRDTKGDGKLVYATCESIVLSATLQSRVFYTWPPNRTHKLTADC